MKNLKIYKNLKEIFTSLQKKSKQKILYILELI